MDATTATRMIELTDLHSEKSDVVEVSAVRRTIRGWYVSVVSLALDSDMIDELHEALNEQDYEEARDLAAELGIGFDEVAG